MVTSAERRLVIPQWREAVTRVEKSSDQATSLPMDNPFASGDDYAGDGDGVDDVDGVGVDGGVVDDTHLENAIIVLQ